MFFFHSWHTFFAMGGYAAYVWSAYLLVFFVLLYTCIQAKYQLNKQLQHLETPTHVKETHASKAQA